MRLRSYGWVRRDTRKTDRTSTDIPGPCGRAGAETVKAQGRGQRKARAESSLRADGRSHRTFMPYGALRLDEFDADAVRAHDECVLHDRPIADGLRRLLELDAFLCQFRRRRVEIRKREGEVIDRAARG